MLNKNKYYKEHFYGKSGPGNYMTIPQLEQFLNFYQHFFKVEIIKSKPCKFCTQCFGIASSGVAHSQNHPQKHMITLAKFFGYSDKNKTVLQRFEKSAIRNWLLKSGSYFASKGFVRVFKRYKSLKPIEQGRNAQTKFTVPEKESHLWAHWQDEDLEILGEEIDLGKLFKGFKANSKLARKKQYEHFLSFLELEGIVIVIRQPWFPLDSKCRVEKVGSAQKEKNGQIEKTSSKVTRVKGIHSHKMGQGSSRGVTMQHSLARNFSAEQQSHKVQDGNENESSEKNQDDFKHFQNPLSRNKGSIPFQNPKNRNQHPKNQKKKLTSPKSPNFHLKKHPKNHSIEKSSKIEDARRRRALILEQRARRANLSIRSRQNSSNRSQDVTKSSFAQKKRQLPLRRALRYSQEKVSFLHNQDNQDDNPKLSHVYGFHKGFHNSFLYQEKKYGFNKPFSTKINPSKGQPRFSRSFMETFNTGTGKMPNSNPSNRKFYQIGSNQDPKPQKKLKIEIRSGLKEKEVEGGAYLIRSVVRPKPKLNTYLQPLRSSQLEAIGRKLDEDLTPDSQSNSENSSDANTDRGSSESGSSESQSSRSSRAMVEESRGYPRPQLDEVLGKRANAAREFLEKVGETGRNSTGQTQTLKNQKTSGKQLTQLNQGNGDSQLHYRPLDNARLQEFLLDTPTHDNEQTKPPQKSRENNERIGTNPTNTAQFPSFPLQNVSLHYLNTTLNQFKSTFTTGIDKKISEKIDQQFAEKMQVEGKLEKVMSTVRETNQRLTKMEKVMESLTLNVNSILKFFKQVYPHSRLFRNRVAYQPGKETPKKVFRYWKKGDRRVRYASKIFKNQKKEEADENSVANYRVKLEDAELMKVKFEEEIDDFGGVYGPGRGKRRIKKEEEEEHTDRYLLGKRLR